MKRFAVLTLLVACGKAEEKAGGPPTTVGRAATPDAAAVAAGGDPSCVARVKELEPFLVQLRLEEDSHEIDFVYTLVVLDRPAAKVEQAIDNVFVTTTAIEPFDETETNRADTKLDNAPSQKAVVDRIAAIKSMGQGDRIRIDVDERARWGDVARTVDAAVAAGYKEASFAFTARSTLAAPAGVEDRTTSVEVFDAAGARLDELGKTCEGLNKYSGDAAEIAAALVACNCAADPDEIRVLRWTLARWGQARPRVGVVVQLGGVGTQKVEQPKDTPWSAAHAKLLEVAATSAVTLVAT
jgi:hypothetical protein